ncbi:MAG: hypothetical protein M3Y03_00860, partial [Verrucomicrobiota bacterium]|nr:hypothetical protein [Verrucomicrobiota bacterium]
MVVYHIRTGATGTTGQTVSVTAAAGAILTNSNFTIEADKSLLRRAARHYHRDRCASADIHSQP